MMTTEQFSDWTNKMNSLTLDGEPFILMHPIETETQDLEDGTEVLLWLSNGKHVKQIHGYYTEEDEFPTQKNFLNPYWMLGSMRGFEPVAYQLKG